MSKKKPAIIRFAEYIPNISLGLTALALMLFSVSLIGSDPSFFTASLSLDSGINACDFTRIGGFIDDGSWKSRLGGLSSLGSGPEDQHAILGYEIICRGSTDCPADSGFKAEQSFVKANIELPLSADSIMMEGLIINDEPKFESIATINGDTQFINGVLRGKLSGGTPTGTILSEGGSVSTNADTSNITLYARRKVASRDTFCGIAVFKINTSFSSTIDGTVTDENGDPVEDASVSIAPCPTNTAGIATVESGVCETSTDATGTYEFTGVLPSRAGYTIDADQPPGT